MDNLVEDSNASRHKEKSNVIILSVAQNHALVSSFLLLFCGDFFVFSRYLKTAYAYCFCWVWSLIFSTHCKLTISAAAFFKIRRDVRFSNPNNIRSSNNLLTTTSSTPCIMRICNKWRKFFYRLEFWDYFFCFIRSHVFSF